MKHTFQRFQNYVLVMIFLMVGFGNANAQLHYDNSISISNGLYSASGFGSNHYIGFRYNHFFDDGNYFFEGAFGISSLKSKVLDSVAGFQIFDSDKLQTYEFLLAYDARPDGSVPFFLLGVAGINQGGQSQFAYLVGLGKQIRLSSFLNSNRFGLRYDIRDQIFRQKINNESFMSHNLIFSLGIQYYF